MAMISNDWLPALKGEFSKEYYKNPVNLRKAQRKLRNNAELRSVFDGLKGKPMEALE